MTNFSNHMAQLVVRLLGRHEVAGSNPGLMRYIFSGNDPVLSGRLVYKR